MSLLDFILQVLFSKSQEASPQKKKKSLKRPSLTAKPS